jgi:hypothetical protein
MRGRRRSAAHGSPNKASRSSLETGIDPLDGVLECRSAAPPSLALSRCSRARTVEVNGDSSSIRPSAPAFVPLSSGSSSAAVPGFDPARPRPANGNEFPETRNAASFRVPGDLAPVPLGAFGSRA